MKTCNVVWFRRDLRISDNEIVSLAAQNGQPTVFVFTLDPWFFKQAEIGAMRVKFLIESLKALDRSLLRLGSRLTILSGESSTVITELLTKLKADGLQPQLFFNRDIQVRYGLERDASVVTWCQQHSIECHQGLAYFLLPHDVGYEQWHDRYYAYQAAAQWHIPDHVMSLSDAYTDGLPQLRTSELFDWVLPYVPGVLTASRFNGGEPDAQKVLQSFLTERYHGYHWKLSRPYLAQLGATSQLSPHIAFGTISTRQVGAAAYDMKQRLKRDDADEVKTLASFVSRVRWRDSFTQRLLQNPDLSWKNRFPEYDMFYTDEPLTGHQAALFEHWKNGTTGFPLLDASMRELASAGWLNFRMRAQAVTMLCIVFGISWHHGARYFMQQLVDGDIAINHWQWQMQAGITNPLSATFRIYDPAKNLRERDPKLQYIHHWLPEYRQLQTIDDVLHAAEPIVDFKASKQKYGTRVSQTRQQVRRRILTEKGPELYEAESMRAVTEHLKQVYRQHHRRKEPTGMQQLDLFESGDA